MQELHLRYKNMQTFHDEVFGQLAYKHGWTREYGIQFFGDYFVVTLIVPGDPDGEPESGQREAFLEFERVKQRLLGEGESALYSFYLSNLGEVRARLGDLADELAPPVTTSAELSRIMGPRAVIVPETFGSPDRVVGLLFDCSWDPQLGVAIKFANERVEDVGPQDIVL